MEINEKIPYFDVIAITKNMCKFINGEEYEIVNVPVELKDGEKLKKYVSVIACTEAEKEELVEEVRKNNGLKKEEFALNKKYCHITTYEEKTKRNFISFDKNDDCPVKASFSEEYQSVEKFFRSFIGFRNNLIKTHNRVKEDDIYQYYIFNVEESAKRKQDNAKLLEKAKRFMSSR